MLQLSLLEESTESSVTFTRAGTMRSGQLCERPTLGPRTVATESSSWERGEYPTPSAVEYGSSQNGASAGHVRPSNGTPSLGTWARDQWPTPNATDYKGATTRSAGKERPASDDDLPTRVARLTEPQQWATPNVPNGGRAMDAETVARRGVDAADAADGVSLTDAAVRGHRGRQHPTTPPAGPATSPSTPTARRPSLALNPAFVEALLNAPRGWTKMCSCPGACLCHRPDRLRALGNGVVVEQGAVEFAVISRPGRTA